MMAKGRHRDIVFSGQTTKRRVKPHEPLNKNKQTLFSHQRK